MRVINYNMISQLLGEDHKLQGNISLVRFKHVKPLSEADQESLVWLKPGLKNSEELVDKTEALTIICDFEQEINPEIFERKCVIRVNNPKKVVISIIENYFLAEQEYGIHPNSIIHPEAKIHPDVYIGPGCIIGNCEIGRRTVLDGRVFVYDGTVIEYDVHIQTGVVIGADGFGYIQEENGKWEAFPHCGYVHICSNVRISSNTVIDKGALGTTKIGRGTKIGSLVKIAHNVIIGEDNLIISGTMINGSVVIGDRVYIGTGANVRNKIRIGDDAYVGMGTVVVKDVERGVTVIGNPGRAVE